MPDKLFPGWVLATVTVPDEIFCLNLLIKGFDSIVVQRRNEIGKAIRNLESK